MLLYELTFGDKKYAGQSRKLEKRLKDHHRLLVNNKHSNRLIQKEFNSRREELITYSAFKNKIITLMKFVSRKPMQSFASFSLEVTFGEQFLLDQNGKLNINKKAGPSLSYDLCSKGGSKGGTGYVDRLADPERYNKLSPDKQEENDKFEEARRKKANGGSKVVYKRKRDEGDDEGGKGTKNEKKAKRKRRFFGRGLWKVALVRELKDIGRVEATAETAEAHY